LRILVAGSLIPALPLACISVKYTVSIEIALPREQVVQLLADPHTYRSGCAAWFCTSR